MLDDVLGLVLPLALTAAAQIPPGDACTMPDDKGDWRPCEEVLREREQAAAPAPKPEPKKRRGGRVAPDMSAVGEHTTPGPRRRGGYLPAIVRDPTLDRHPLVQLREDVEQLEAKVTEGASEHGEYARMQALKREAEIARATLDYVEVLALREVRDCVAQKYPDRVADYAPPAAFRVTAGGPVPTTEDERAVGESPDPPGCERVRLIEEETVAKARRLQNIERLLEEDGFGWHKRDEKRALKRERETLLAELRDPFRIPELKPTRTYRDKEVKPIRPAELTPMKPINPRR